MLELLVAFVVLGFAAWLVLTYVPLAEPFRIGFLVLCGLIVLVLILQTFGVLHIGHGLLCS